MDTSVDRVRLGLTGAKTRQGLTDAKLRELQPGARTYKVSDGGNGLYVVVSPSGSRSFRYDYRLGGRRETLTIGRHEAVARHAQRSHLAYGMDVTLGEFAHPWWPPPPQRRGWPRWPPRGNLLVQPAIAAGSL